MKKNQTLFGSIVFLFVLSYSVSSKAADFQCLLSYYDSSGAPVTNQEARKPWGQPGSNWIEFTDSRFSYHAEMKSLANAVLTIRDLDGGNEIQTTNYVLEGTVFRLDRTVRNFIRSGFQIERIILACIRNR